MPAHRHPARGSAALALAALTAATVLSACSSPAPRGTLTEIRSTGTATSPAAERPAVIPKTEPSATPTARPTSRQAAPVAPADYRPISDDPSKEYGLDFGFMTKIVSQGGVVTMVLDRAGFYTGAEAVERNGGSEPIGDYVIENESTKKRTFVVDPKASIVAQNQLLADRGLVEEQTLTVTELVQNAARTPVLREGGVPVWVRHSGGPDGPITALQEQYLP